MSSITDYCNKNYGFLGRVSLLVRSAIKLSAVILLWGHTAAAQNPKITMDTNGKEFTVEKSKLYYSSTLDTLHLPASGNTGSVIHDVVYNNKVIKNHLLPLDCTVKAPFGIQINNCHFVSGRVQDYSSQDCENYIPTLVFARQVYFNECSFNKELAFNNIASSSFAAQLNVTSDTASYFDLSNSNLRLATVNGNDFKGSINVSWTHFGTAIFATNSHKDTAASFSSSYCSYKIASQNINNHLRNANYSTDTLNGFFRFVADTTYWNDPKDTIRQLSFINCYINANVSISISDKLYHSKVLFDGCSFGSLASILNVKTDTLEFINCPNIPYPLFLTPDPSKKVICIQIINSNVANIRFDYTEKFRLFFDKNITEETKNNTYQSLLGKYKSEGKPQNIEKIDIEYKRYLYSQHFYNYPIWLLDYIWWRYSYSKWLVILWCVLFLMIFFSYNWVKWDQMQTVYSVYQKEKPPRRGQVATANLLPRKAVYVFVFTSFIFFSLKVDFDKLKYTDRKFLLIFFIQYLVGLVCLFFLANAIFKI